MADTNPGATVSSRALDSLLDTDTPQSKAIKSRFHRTMLWRLRTGRRSPDLDTAAEIEKLTRGTRPVTAIGWTLKKGAPPSESTAAPTRKTG